ncbi:MAG: hypothetical protein M3546_15175 [Actinomycetota bacterium]|nr:hypothetical protein [Actinomycetota bacterium]
MPSEKHETAAGDELAAYLATVPKDLNANAWGRWRAKNRPPYFLAENRRGGKCGLCGSELSAWLNLCHGCMSREFEYLRELLPLPKEPRPIPGTGGRTLREEWRDYPDEGRYRLVARKLWFVVRDADGQEVTRTLERTDAERYL